MKFKTAWVLGLSLCFVPFAGSRAMASERITENQVASLIPRLFEMHLKQHSMDAEFMRRILKQFAVQLDPGRNFYLKSEVEAMQALGLDDIARIEAQALGGDLTHFRKLLDDFVAVQLARDTALYGGLEQRTAEINGPNAADDNDDDDKMNWLEFPQNQVDREGRVLRRAHNTFVLNRAYLSTTESFTLAIQSIRRERQKWLDMSKPERDVEVPGLFLKSFMNAMDPHTDYFDDSEEDFSGRLERNFAGIGIQIRPCPLGVYVEEIIKGGPSERSGNLAPGDQITAVDGFALAALPIAQCVKRIKGERGTDVRLTVLRRKKTEQPAAQPRTEEIVMRRDTVELASLRVKGKTLTSSNANIGVVSVQTFYRGVHNDVRDRLRELSEHKQLDGVVLDLRGNHGGYLDEAIGVAGLFLDHATVVGERDADGKVDWKDSPDSPFFSGPLVVLTDQFSASASEIVAGALQDHNRTLVVAPSQTFGKGTVQRVVQLSMYNAPGEMKVTTHQYFLPSGSSVQTRGVPPDVTVPGRKLEKDSLESGNENALPWTRIDGHLKLKSDYKAHTEWKAKMLADIMARSKERVAAAKTEWDDALDLKKKREADAAKVPQSPDEAPAPPNPDTAEKLSELQETEAAAVAADIGKSWPKWSRGAVSSDP